MDRRREPWSRSAAVAVGLLLVVVGLVFLVVQWSDLRLPFDLSRLGWPLYIIVPGVVLLVAGLLTGAESGVGLATAGGIVTTVGLILAYQESTSHWASWAYAWALVAPGSVGASMLLWAALHGRGGLIRGGLSALAVGLVMFLVGFAFFEGVLSIGGDRGIAPLGRQALPAALILAGVLIIISRLWPSPRNDWAPAMPAPGDIPPATPPDPPSAAPPDPQPAADATDKSVSDGS
jgi:hypothetical protein